MLLLNIPLNIVMASFDIVVVVEVDACDDVGDCGMVEVIVVIELTFNQ